MRAVSDSRAILIVVLRTVSLVRLWIFGVSGESLVSLTTRWIGLSKWLILKTGQLIVIIINLGIMSICKFQDLASVLRVQQSYYKKY